MIFFGERAIFAIECNIARIINKHIYINFQYWADGKNIGDFNAEIDLSSCRKRMSRFLKMSHQRYEQKLEGKTKEEILGLIYDSVILTIPEGTNLDEILSDRTYVVEDISVDIEDIEERFHLDSIGSSSFDDEFSVVLLETKLGYDRLIWRVISSMDIFEAAIPSQKFDIVSQEFLDWADGIIQSL